MIINTLQSALVALHQTRVAAAQINDQVRTEREAWENEHIVLLGGQQAAKAALDQAETYARNLALMVYAETGDKRPTLGVEVKDKTKVVIPDKAAALAWAIKHEEALVVDWKMFEVLVKAKNGIPGVAEVVTEPQATLATDLTKAVAALLGEEVQSDRAAAG